MCQEGKPQAAVDRTLDRKAFRGWTETDNPWTNDDETDNGMNCSCFVQINSLGNFLGKYSTFKQQCGVANFNLEAPSLGNFLGKYSTFKRQCGVSNFNLEATMS